MKIRAIIHSAEEGGYWAEVPALPGCITEGDTMEEVMANLKDAMVGWLDVANSHEAIAYPRSFPHFIQDDAICFTLPLCSGLMGFSPVISFNAANQ